MQRFITQYKETGDLMFLYEAQKLRKSLTKPYQLLIRLNGITKMHFISAFVPFEQVQRLTEKIRECNDLDHIDSLIQSLDRFGN
jgi:hypothetical protein